MGRAERRAASFLLVVLVSVGAAAPQRAPGAVRDLVFRPDPDGGGSIIAWLPPADVSAARRDRLAYEVQDRGAGPWRQVHQGPEVRLRVLQAREGPCSLRVRAVDADSGPGPWSETDCTVRLDAAGSVATEPTDPQGCVEGDGVACVHARFALELEWRDGAASVAGVPVVEPGADIVFVHPDAPSDRVAVTIVDGCDRNGHYWVEYRARSARAFLLRARDTRARLEKTFLDPASRDRAASVRYTNVFPSCSRLPTADPSRRLPVANRGGRGNTSTPSP